MSQRLAASFLSALLLAGLPAAAIAQEEPTTATDMWLSTVKKDAQAVAPYAGGFVLVGGAAKKPNAKIWLSDDGSTWSRVPDEDKFDGVALKRVTAFGDGIVALGTQGRKLVSLYSPDGVSWTKRNVGAAAKGMELFPDAVTDGPAGLIAATSMIGQDLAGQRFYASTDGTTWQEIDPPSDTAQGIFTSITATDDEYIALARPFFMPADDLYWRSPDGVSWESFEGPAEGYLHDLAMGADGTFAAVGQLDGTFLPAVWHATELGDWEQVYSVEDSKETEEGLQVVSAGGPGFIAGGSTSSCPQQPNRYCPTAGILVSTDGLTWEALGVEDGVPGPLHDTIPQSIAAGVGSTVMVAWHQDRPMEVWTVPASE